jgi:hypothetical protein
MGQSSTEKPSRSFRFSLSSIQVPILYNPWYAWYYQKLIISCF